MRARIGFTVAAVAAWVGALICVLVAGGTVAVGVAALTGHVAYPYTLGVGPATVTLRIALPVGAAGPVCQQASVSDQGVSDCQRFFVHSDPTAGGTALRRQDADIRPAEVILNGEVLLTTTPGWNPYVAAAVLAAAVKMLLIATVFALTARILRAAAAGEALSSVSTRRVRTIGVVVLALAASGPLLGGLTRADVLGYWTESFGSGLHLVPDDDLGVPLATAALGVLLILVAEIFRHGAALEDEVRLTV